jgi:hypothetical protein
LASPRLSSCCVPAHGGAGILSVAGVPWPSVPSVFTVSGLDVVAGTLMLFVFMLVFLYGFPGVAGVSAISLDPVFAGIPGVGIVHARATIPPDLFVLLSWFESLYSTQT